MPTKAQLVKKKRTEKGWSQEKLAKRAKLNRSTIARWEGRLSRPSELAWARVRKALDF